MKISYEEFKGFEKSFNAGEFPHQRFGQAFENHFDICPGVWGDGEENKTMMGKCIWNAERDTALKVIYEHYISFEEAK